MYRGPWWSRDQASLVWKEGPSSLFLSSPQMSVTGDLDNLISWLSILTVFDFLLLSPWLPEKSHWDIPVSLLLGGGKLKTNWSSPWRPQGWQA
jgi:hypothetical protein